MEKNYRISTQWINEVDDDNLKKMADYMMHNANVAHYDDGKTIANAFLKNMWGERPHMLCILIGDKEYNFPLTSKRVSEKMGKEIIEYILKAVAFYKAEAKIKVFVDEIESMDESTLVEEVKEYQAYEAEI